MRVWRTIIGCSLVCISCSCRTAHHKDSTHLTRDGSILSCREQAFSEALAHYSQGLIYNAIDATNSTRTLSEFNLALDSAPDDYYLQSRIAVIAIKRNEAGEAVEILNTAYQRKPHSYKHCLNLAAVYQATSRNQQAITQYRKCLKLENSEAAVYIALAKLYFESNQNKKAYKTLKRGIKKSDDTELIQYYTYEQAKIFLSKKDFNRAIASFKLLTEWDQAKKAQLYQLIAELFITQSRDAEATEILLQATKLPYPLPASFIRLAAIQLQHDTAKGIKTLKTAKMQIPNNRDILFALGCLYIELAEYSKAIPYFESAKRNAFNTTGPSVVLPNFTETFYLYHGAAYEQTGDIAKAGEIFEECIQKYPNSHHVLNYQAYMWAEAGINLQKSLEYITRALKLSPGNPAYIDTLGWVYYKQNKFDLALEQTEKAYKIIGDDSEILNHLGDIHHAMKNNKKAIACWKKSFSLNNKNKSVAKKLVELGIILD